MNVIKEGHRIKDRLREAKTEEQIERIADEEREKVLGMKDTTPDGNAMYHQIKNLKLFMLRQIRAENQDGRKVSKRR